MSSLSCSELGKEIESIRNDTRSINGISEQFVEDIDAILDKFQKNEFVILAVKRYVSISSICTERLIFFIHFFSKNIAVFTFLPFRCPRSPKFLK